MEGPSLVIAVEELKPFLKKKVRKAEGTAKLPFKQITGTSLKRAQSWGKHLLLHFDDVRFRIHFLMFGSYRIDDPREGREPKLRLSYADGRQIDFYSCAIKEMPKGFERDYDFSIDLMSPEWDARQARAAVARKPEAEVADVLMDQAIFSGLGNIMKNEILYNLRLHPETRVRELTPAQLRALVKEAEDYAWRFYEWKKANVLKRNWKIMRKKKCPRCEGPVTKAPTGRLQRFSHWCEHCQVRPAYAKAGDLRGRGRFTPLPTRGSTNRRELR